MCCQIYGKSAQVAKCVKSSIITKVNYCVILIDTFEKKCAVPNGMLQLPRIKYHTETVGIDQ